VHQTSFMTIVGRAVLMSLAASSIFLLGSMQVGAPVESRTSAPLCEAKNIRVELSIPAHSYSRQSGFRASVLFENRGKNCTLPVTNVTVQAVNGSRRVHVGQTSANNLVGYSPIFFRHQQQASAVVSISSIDTAAFKKTLRNHGGRCDPKNADGLEILGYQLHWPTKYFPIPENVPVCTKDYFNVSGEVLKLR
jgi:hypothetical protein